MGFVHDLLRTEYDPKLNSPAMIAAMLLPCLVVILYICARCLLRERAQQRSPEKTTAVGIHLAQPPRDGLSPSVIASLPIFVFRQANGNNHNHLLDSTMCSVCLNNIEDGEMARALQNCKPTFHANCIDKWFTSSSTCPLCRTEAKSRLVAEPRETMVGARTAPELTLGSEIIDFASISVESTSGGGGTQPLSKIRTSSRLRSFRRMLIRERSSQCGQEVSTDLERQ